MSDKVIDMRDGDGWTRFDKNGIVQYRDGKDRTLAIDEVGSWCPALRTTQETDITDDEAKAWLELKGYRVDDQRSKQPPLSETRVREIVREELGKQRSLSIATVDQIVAEVREDVRRMQAKAPSPPDAEPDWRRLLADVVKAWKFSELITSSDSGRVADFDASPALAKSRKALADLKKEAK